MTDDRPQETHKELFPEFSSAPKHPERYAALAKTQKPILVSTTLEQLLMISIVFILVLCSVFFLGVLRGKSLKQVSGAVPVVRVESPKAPPPVVQRPGVPVPAPAAAKTTPVPTVVPASDKPYTIQLVTHRKKEYAENEVNAVRKLGFASFIIPSGEYFQVCAGQYASKEEARRDLSFFQSRYKDSFLRRHA